MKSDPRTLKNLVLRLSVLFAIIPKQYCDMRVSRIVPGNVHIAVVCDGELTRMSRTFRRRIYE